MLRDTFVIEAIRSNNADTCSVFNFEVNIMVSYTENGVNIRVRLIKQNPGDDFLLVSIDGGKWEPAENYPQIDAWDIYWSFAE